MESERTGVRPVTATRAGAKTIVHYCIREKGSVTAQTFCERTTYGTKKATLHECRAAQEVEKEKLVSNINDSRHRSGTGREPQIIHPIGKPGYIVVQLMLAPVLESIGKYGNRLAERSKQFQSYNLAGPQGVITCERA